MSEGGENPSNETGLDLKAIKNAAENKKANQEPDFRLEEEPYEVALEALSSLRPLLESNAVGNQLELPPEAIISAQRMIGDIYEVVNSGGDVITDESSRGRSGNYETLSFTMPLGLEGNRKTEEIRCYLLREQGETVAANLAFRDRKLSGGPKDLLKALGRPASKHGLHLQDGTVLQVCVIIGEKDAVLGNNDLLIRALAGTSGVEPMGLKAKVTGKLPDKVIEVLMSRGASVSLGATGLWRDPATQIEYVLETESGLPELWKRFPGIENPDGKPAVYLGRINCPPDSEFKKPERDKASWPNKKRSFHAIPVGVTA